ncbi:MAG: J domain-containing protein [Verrucomicrobiae bacterium]|nr:J domain-containing protein [Verrucomicrobiae bacterium]
MNVTNRFEAELPADGSPVERSLTIGKARGKPLTHAQKTFNRWIRRIEDLRRTLEGEAAGLDRLIGIYAAELHPIELAIVEQRKGFVRALRPFLNTSRLTGRNQRRHLRELLHQQLGEIQGMEDAWKDADLEELWNELDAAFLDRMKSMAEAEFGAMGIPMDLSRFRAGMTPDEFQDALEDMQRQVEKAPDPEPEPAPQRSARTRPGAKPRLTSEDRERLEEELRQRDLGSLYKQLAKLLHPDLESNPARRETKESAMKRLTTAYKDRDLHALLELELEWIHAEGADASRLSGEKLRVYNGILRDQVDDLERRLNELPMHPRYAPLHRYCGPFDGPGTLDPREIRRQLTVQLKDLKELATRLAGPDALPVVRQLLQEFSSRVPFPDFFF